MKKFFAAMSFFAAAHFAGACGYSSLEPFVNWDNPRGYLHEGASLDIYAMLKPYLKDAEPNPKMKAKYDAARPREKSPAEDTPQYRQYRESLAAYKAALEDAWNPEEAQARLSEAKAKFAEFSTQRGEIPPQLFEYECGAFLYAQKDFAAAQAHFKKAYEMPESLRKMEAAFMLMRCAQKINPESDEVLNAYKNICRLFEDGCPDPQKLAFESEGYLAMWHLARGENFEALQIYFDRCAIIKFADYAARGYEPAWSESCESLLAALKKCVGANLEKMAASPVFAELATSYLTNGKCDAELLALWLEILNKNGAPIKSFGGRIALKLYEAGNFAAARRALELSDENEPLARWVKSKFLIMQGDEKAAAQILADLIKNYSESGLQKFESDGFSLWGMLPNGYFAQSNEPEFRSARHSLFDASSQNETPLRSKIIAEYGLLKFSSQDKAGALECFLAAGYLMDAAYVCENLMSLDELKNYADANLEDKSGKADFVRAILTLRIFREENSFEGARKYFSGGKEYVEFMSSLALALKTAADESKPAEVRAAANWEIFTLYCEGAAEMFVGFFETTPEGDKSTSHLYTAFDFALKAADMTPDRNLAARMYASAGWKLKARDPKYVLPAYKNLCARCRGTKEGEEAWKTHWLPAKMENPRAVLADLKKKYPR